jgi:hypothetical protein
VEFYVKNLGYHIKVIAELLVAIGSENRWIEK